MHEDFTITGQLIYLTHNEDIEWKFDSQTSRYFFIKKITSNKYIKFELFEHPTFFIEISFVKKHGTFGKEIRFIKNLNDLDLIGHLYKMIISKPIKYSKDGKEE